jgi:hypothetical protein
MEYDGEIAVHKAGAVAVFMKYLNMRNLAGSLRIERIGLSCSTSRNLVV